MSIIIGIDPHKSSHTAVAIDEGEEELARVRVLATRRQVDHLMDWAGPFEKRTWAIESAGGLGYLLSQQLIAAGEEVLDVPATLASRIGMLASGRSNKNDPTDARSVAIAALRSASLRAVRPTDSVTEVLRLLAKRNSDLGNQRTQVVSRLHALLQTLSPGGISKDLYASDAERFLGAVRPQSPVEQARCDMAYELLDAPPRRSAQGLTPADPRCGQGLGNHVDRPLRGGPDHRQHAHRLHGRRSPVRQSGPVRRLQRHRPDRAVLRGERLSTASPSVATAS